MRPYQLRHPLQKVTDGIVCFSSFVALGVRSNDSWHSENIPYLILEHEGGSRQADKHYDNAQGQ